MFIGFRVKSGFREPICKGRALCTEHGSSQEDMPRVVLRAISFQGPLEAGRKLNISRDHQFTHADV